MVLTMNEHWRPVAGCEGFYEASDQGQVRSVSRFVRVRGNGQRWVEGRVLQANGTPYPMVNLWVQGRSQPRKVHQLVAEAFLGPCPPGQEVCHENDIGSDNRLTNLRYDTRPGNAIDAIRNGRNHFANRTHCPLEHKLALPNLIKSDWARGHRSCLACHRGRAAVQYATRTGRALDLRTVADRQYQRIMTAA